VGDGAVLAAGVHSLQHDEQRTLAFGVEALVPVEELVLMLLHVAQRAAVAAFQAGRRIRVDIRHPKPPVTHACAQKVADLFGLRHR
jgi:hypothetical protein